MWCGLKVLCGVVLCKEEVWYGVVLFRVVGSGVEVCTFPGLGFLSLSLFYLHSYTGFI